jgi:predicted nuclease of predicted toxin-antitoxin system
MTRILLDQGLSPAAAVELRESGHDAIHVAEVGLDRAAEAEILAFAQDGRVCVTLDHDFHTPSRKRMGPPSFSSVWKGCGQRSRLN